MQVDPQRKAAPGYFTVSEVHCPLCQGKLLRERRRMVDRLRSLLKPVKRYRCENFDCQWVGNIANPLADVPATGVAAGAQFRGTADEQSRDVPVLFVVHMVLVAVGVVFVFVFSAMEPTSWIDENEQAFESSFYESMPERPVHRANTR